MTNSEISKQVGRTETWLANIKLHRPKRYKYLLSFNKNKLQSIIECENYIVRLEEQVQALFYEDKKRYHRILEEAGVGFGSKNAIYNFTKKLFSLASPLSRNLGTIEQYKRIVEVNKCIKI